MEQKIRDSIAKPEYLEHLYHEDKKQFSEAFAKVVKHQPTTDLIKFWQTRLLFAKEQIDKNVNAKLNLLPLFISIALVAFFIRLADVFNLSPIATDMYQFRNPALIVFMGLTVYGMSRTCIPSLYTLDKLASVGSSMRILIILDSCFIKCTFS